MILAETYRLGLSEHELDTLKSLVRKHLKDEIYDDLKEKLNNPKIINYSAFKVNATVKATEARTAKAKEKIEKAHKQLELDLKRGFIKKISYYGISKKSGVHINTVKKYITLDEVKA